MDEIKRFIAFLKDRDVTLYERIWVVDSEGDVDGVADYPMTDNEIAILLEEYENARVA